MTPPEQVARAAFEAGFSVVPGSMDKVPKVPWKRWQTEGQTEDEFDFLGHGSLWAVVTGALYGIVVLDFDFDAGGEETLQALGLQHKVTVDTPGGAHVYVQHPGRPVKTNARAFPQYPGLDVRGDGGLAWFAGRSKKGVYTPVVWPPTPVELSVELAEELFPAEPEKPAQASLGTWEGDGQGTPEAVRFVGRACQDIRHADPGTSNQALNKAGYSVGGLIASGQLDEAWAYEQLAHAGTVRGASDVAVVLRAAIESGKAAPWKFTPAEDDPEWAEVRYRPSWSTTDADQWQEVLDPPVHEILDGLSDEEIEHEAWVCRRMALDARTLSLREVVRRRPPRWLVPGLLQQNALAELVGPSRGGKSFLALTWGLDLAAAGRTVLYAAAEGREFGRATPRR